MNKTIRYETKEEITEEVEIDRIDMFGNNYIEMKTIGEKWIQRSLDYSEEMYQYILKAEARGECRNIEVY